MPSVLLVRHGQASFGSDDYDVLSEVGHRQAEVVAAYGRKYGRAYDTGAFGQLTRVTPATVLAWRAAGWAGQDSFTATGRWTF